MARPAQLVALLAITLCAAGSAGTAAGAPAVGASAHAHAIRVVSPAGEAGTREVSAPPDAVEFGGGFAYPADGSIVATGAVTATVSATTSGTVASASASAEVASVSLFGGEVTIETVSGRASASARDGDATGSTAGSAVAGLVVAGVPVEATAGQVPLGDWGYADVLTQGTAPTDDGQQAFVTALDIHVTVEHGGLPAGSEILIGYAEASATAPEPPSPAEPAEAAPLVPPAVAPRTRPPSGAVGKARPPGPRSRAIPPIVRRPLPGIAPRLTRKGYVFPVHGPASFADTFGAGRAVVGWHHGEDIFAPIGAPVLAVAKGTVFAVGWNDLGGNRLWLRDEQGNEFYYAHLSAFSPLAVNGAHVAAGDVLGFVGNSGDAETTPPHLHFEIHPVGLLVLGYDGVINPYPYLLAWRRLEDVRFVAGATWTPSLAQVSDAPTPGAFLLASTDIASARGLDAQALRQVMDAQPSAEAAATG